MLITKEKIDSIKEKQITLVKNFTILNKEYDFNFISNTLEKNYLKVFCKTTYGNFKDVFQIEKINFAHKEFAVFYDFLKKIFKYSINEKYTDGVDLFFSFTSQVGDAHTDLEDVFIIGLKGKTIYRVFDKETIDYEINKGDLIFIPKGIKHKVLGITPRIIASIGFFGERF